MMNNLINTTLRIIEIVFEIMDEAPGVKLSRRSLYSIMNNSFNEWSDSKKANWIGSLKQSGYIRIDKSGGQDSIILTNKAKIKLIERNRNKFKTEKCNRFVSFDIPEEKKAQRNQFRRILKRIGFVQIQKSLWVINKDIGNLVEIAAEECGVNEYVAYIISDQSNIDKFIKSQILKRKSSDNISEEIH